MAFKSYKARSLNSPIAQGIGTINPNRLQRDVGVIKEQLSELREQFDLLNSRIDASQSQKQILTISELKPPSVEVSRKGMRISKSSGKASMSASTSMHSTMRTFEKSLRKDEDEILDELEDEQKRGIYLRQQIQNMKQAIHRCEGAQRNYFRLEKEYGELSQAYNRSERIRSKQKEIITELKSELEEFQ